MEKRTSEQILTDLKKYQAALALVKSQYQSLTDELIEFCNHTRRKITDTGKGTATGTEVYDGTAESANRIQADGFFGNLCSQALRWFNSGLPIRINWPQGSGNMRKWSGKRLDEMPEIKAWLEGVDDVLYAAFLQSNFYDEMPIIFRDGGSVGAGNMDFEDDFKRGKKIYTVLHPREYFIALDASGKCDTRFREYKLSLKALKEKFGLEALKEDIPDVDRRFEENPYQEYDTVHAIIPRSDYDPLKKDNKNKPWGSYWYLKAGKKLLLESGSQYYKNIHWQYYKGNDGYGYGPGHEAYVSIMLANQQAQTNLVAGQKMIEPPLVAHHSLRGAVRRGPKGVTYVTTMDLMPKQLMEAVNLPYALDMLERTAKIIKEKWHVDFFLMLSQAAFDRLDITATQVMEMVSEKATMLGTVIGRIANDVLNPIIDLNFYAEMEAGRIPPLPQIMADLGLSNVNIEIDYNGPLAVAQKRAHSTQGIRQGLSFIGNLTQIYPSAIKKVRWSETITKGLTDLGFPASLIVSDDEFKVAIDAEQKAQADMMKMQAATEAAKALPALGKAIEPNSPAEALIRAGGGQLQAVDSSGNTGGTNG